MTLCNMTIEAGARSGLIGVDEITIEYLRGRRYAPAGELWDRAVEEWLRFKTDEGAEFDATISIDASDVTPTVSWGTVPDMSVGIDDVLPNPLNEPDMQRRSLLERAYTYMGLKPGTPVKRDRDR